MTRLAFPPDITVMPLTYAIVNNLVPHPFQVKIADQAWIAAALEAHDIDIGIISPLHYARLKSGYKVLQDIIITSPQRGRNSLLFFRKDISEIDAVFFTENPDHLFDEFIAQVALKEFLNVTAEWKKLPGKKSVESQLENYPVVLVTGAEAFDALGGIENYIDLSEEWYLKTGHPLVHKMLVVSGGFEDRGEIEILKRARDLGVRNYSKIAKAYSLNRPNSWAVYHELLTDCYQYYPLPNSWDSLNEIVHYLFYYGKIEYLPDIKFL